MNWWDSATAWARAAWADITGIGRDAESLGKSLWHYIQQTAQGLEYILTHPVEDVENAVALLAALVTGNMTAARNATARLQGFYTTHVLEPNLAWIKRRLAALAAEIATVNRILTQMILSEIAMVLHRMTVLFAAERKAREAGDRAAEAYANTRVKWALGLIQKEAASGYSADKHARLSLIARLAEDIAGRNPAVNDIAKWLIKALLDVAEIDDPVLRIAIGFGLKEIVDRLGIDRAAGELLSGLAGPFAAAGPPRDLHAVIVDICARLDAMEGEWAQFMASGGSQVEQAGAEWDALTSIGGDLILVGLFGGMIADPRGFASDMAAVGGPVISRAVDGINGILGA